MHKKLIMACMAIAAFAAFVMAPAASAASLTEGGTAVAVGSSITGTAGVTKFTAGSETVTCSAADMSGTVTANSNGTVAGEILAANTSFTGTATGGDCTSEGLGPVKPTVNSKLCLHVAKGTDVGTVTGCAGAAITFTLNVTNLGIACRYEKASLNAEITTAVNGKDAEVNVVSGQSVPRESNFLCPASGELDMEFVLTTTGGTTLQFS
jgi:hypothetical protein